MYMSLLWSEGRLGAVSGSWEVVATGEDGYWGVGGLGMSAKNLEIYAKVFLTTLTYDILYSITFKFAKIV